MKEMGWMCKMLTSEIPQDAGRELEQGKTTSGFLLQQLEGWGTAFTGTGQSREEAGLVDGGAGSNFLLRRGNYAKPMSTARQPGVKRRAALETQQLLMAAAANVDGTPAGELRERKHRLGETPQRHG